MFLDPEDVIVGERVRQDVATGISDLVDSIKKLNRQLQPIIIDANKNLICGARRLMACKLLGRKVWAETADSFESATALLLAERDENTCRKAFTPSELYLLIKKLKSIEAPKAKERYERTQFGRQKKPGCSTSDTPVNAGRTNIKIANAVGKGRTYCHEVETVFSAAAKPDSPPEVKTAAQKVDAGSSVKAWV